MNYQPHELALLFPSMTEMEFNELKRDIEQHGQQNPITIYEDKILDGIHRARACVLLEKEPKTTIYGGSNPVAYVVATNLHRRHLTTSQRAMLGVELIPHVTREQRKQEQERERVRLEKEAKKRLLENAKLQETLSKTDETENKANLPYSEIAPTPIPPTQSRDVVSKMIGVSPRSLQTAKTIASKHPEFIQEIKDGSKTIAGVEKIISAAKSIKEKRTEVDKTLLKMQTKPNTIKVGKQGERTVIVIGHARAELTPRQTAKLKEVL